jgi:hypothetical protein
MNDPPDVDEPDLFLTNRHSCDVFDHNDALVQLADNLHHVREFKHVRLVSFLFHMW